MWTQLFLVTHYIKASSEVYPKQPATHLGLEKNPTGCIFWCLRYDPSVDNYAKDGGPGEVWHLCSFYRDPLRP